MTIADIDLRPPAAPAVAPRTPRPTPPGPAVARPSRVRGAAASVGWALVGLTVLGLLWQLAASRVQALPDPADALAELRALLADPFHDGGPNDKGIGLQLRSSLQRVGTGFAFAAVIGVPLGLAMGAVPPVWKALNPLVQLLRPVSPLAWFPLWLVALEDAPQAAIWVIFITALWPIVLNTAAGAGSIPRDQRNIAKVFRFSRTAYVRHILIPSSLPSIVTGLRLSMGVSWMVIVAVEMLSGGVGIGFFVWDAYNALNLARVVAAIVLIGVIGVALDTAFLRLSRAVSLPEVHS